ncbi:ATP-binding protein [Actinoplanes subglobosus]|uniref:Sensor-like histidine kinase SenX3 n=1 Tax=Actinoplanes subglobosus TaxID=1547892 RepID=A0ABV8IK95_9ACTN
MKVPGAKAAPLLAGVVAILGLTATWTTASSLRAQQQLNIDLTMDGRTRIVLEAARTESTRFSELLATVAASLSTREAMTITDFRAATDPLAAARLSGAASVSFVVPSTAQQLPEVQRLWRTRGPADLVLRPVPGDDDQLAPIFTRRLDNSGYVRSGSVNLPVASEPGAALQAARDTNLVTVSDTYVLAADRARPAAEQQLSFVFAAPIREPDGARRFRGWLVLAMRGMDFLRESLAGASIGQLGVQLLTENAAGEDQIVANLQIPGRPDLRRTVMVPVGDRTWTLSVGADSERLPGADTDLPLVIGAGGSLLSLLLAGLVYTLAAGRARARKAAADIGRAESESRRQAGLLTAVMTSMSEGVGVVDDNGRFLMHNPAAQSLFGVHGDPGTPEQWQQHFGLFEADGQKPFPIDDMPLVRALHGEASDGVEMLVRNTVKTDGILISVSGRPLDPGAGQHGAVAVFRDITELRRYETDLAVFAGVVAHDLKAPLAVIGGRCDMAGYALDDEEPDEVRDALSAISRTVTRMAAMIETLLAYTTARNSTLTLAPVDLNALVAEVIKDRVAHLADDERPMTDVKPLPTVPADRAMLRHVLDNLIGNSLKYVQHGTVARIEVRPAPAADGEAGIEVADRGIGIPDEHKPSVFDRFHRAHTSSGYAGTGLGLAICKTIVERHGGQISVADNPGGGTCFRFTLPLA